VGIFDPLNIHQLQHLLEANVLAAAPALLGWTLVRGEMRARIVEVEAYRGADDRACHAFGKTKMKNMALFGPPGRAYVYLNYGVHWMLNISAHEEGNAAGILIRAAEPLAGLEEMRANRPGVTDRELLRGPGKLGRAFGVGPEDNGLDLLKPESRLHLEEGDEVRAVVTGPRVGIASGKGDELPWRFIDAGRLISASRPLPSPRYRHKCGFCSSKCRACPHFDRQSTYAYR
jgi:DNA-3-methyladenine glycosylase